MNFLIKWPTRARADKFTACIKEWISMLSGEHNVLFLVSQDTDDPDREKVYQRFPRNGTAPGLAPYYQPVNQPLARVEFIEGGCKTKIEAINYGVAGRSFDILISAADDMRPLFRGFDEMIAQEMRRYFPARDGALFFWDGSPRRDGLCTMSIMGHALFARFGYIYNPAYVSLWADNEFTEATKLLGKLAVPQGYAAGERCLIKHCHPVWDVGGAKNYDALMRRNEAAELYARDERTFRERLARRFDLGEI